MSCEEVTHAMRDAKRMRVVGPYIDMVLSALGILYTKLSIALEEEESSKLRERAHPSARPRVKRVRDERWGVRKRDTIITLLEKLPLNIVLVDVIEHYKTTIVYDADNSMKHEKMIALILFLAYKERYEEIQIVCKNFKWTERAFISGFQDNFEEPPEEEAYETGVFPLMFDTLLTTPTYLVERLLDNVPTCIMRGEAGLKFLLSREGRIDNRIGIGLLNKILKVNSSILLEPLHEDIDLFVSPNILFSLLFTDSSHDINDDGDLYGLWMSPRTGNKALKYILVFVARQWRTIKSLITEMGSFLPSVPISKLISFLPNPLLGYKMLDDECDIVFYRFLAKLEELNRYRSIETFQSVKRSLVMYLNLILDFAPGSFLEKRYTDGQQFYQQYKNWSIIEVIKKLYDLPFPGVERYACEMPMRSNNEPFY